MSASQKNRNHVMWLQADDTEIKIDIKHHIQSINKTRKPCKINIKWIKINVPHSKYHF